MFSLVSTDFEAQQHVGVIGSSPTKPAFSADAGETIRDDPSAADTLAYIKDLLTSI